MGDSHVDIAKGKAVIEAGSAILGIEFGSTRIKASLIAPDGTPLADGSFGWENQLQDGIWTYDLDAIRNGFAESYKDLKQIVQTSYGVSLSSIAAMGVSAMMHGYIVLDSEDTMLTPFRTWRNNITGEASEKLLTAFNFAIPQRWSIAHLYQAILNNEKHVSQISFMTTLAGYVHYLLTGKKVIGLGDGSGMFPIDPETTDYDNTMLSAFNSLIADKNYSWTLKDILPEVLAAGETGGTLTEAGARLLDPSGELKPGIPVCPPEGDAQTGMVATNSVRAKTGNVSAGTSVFAMVVLEKSLSKPHTELDIVQTPDGKPVAMAHSNNCTSDFNAWIELFNQAAQALGINPTPDELYGKLMPLALEGAADAGEILHYSYLSGEHITGFTEGRPLFVRKPDADFTLAGFLRSLLFSALCALRTGLDILIKDEKVSITEIRGHGGLFKTEGVGQKIMAAATNSPVSLPATAGEGGSWGMAILAAYMIREDKNSSLPDYLDKLIADTIGEAVKPDPKDVEGFEAYFKRYHACLNLEREAVNTLK